MCTFNNTTKVNEESIEYWKQRALNAEQEITVLQRKISSIPERLQQIVQTSVEAMIEDQILRSKRVTIFGKVVIAKERRYESGHAKLVLVDNEGNDFLEVSVDRPDVQLQPNEIVISTSKENQKVIQTLQKAGLINNNVEQLEHEHAVSRFHV